MTELTKTKPGVWECMIDGDIVDGLIFTRNVNFIHRGLGKSSYPLIPGAFRTGKEDEGRRLSDRIAEKYMRPQKINAAGFDQKTKEIFVLNEFYMMANAQGLDVPRMDGGRRLDFREGMCREKYSDWLEVAALAQHYGIPTRLLDWTTDPLVALYFAVEDEEKDADDAAIWMLHRGNCFEISESEIQLILPRYKGNPFIAAQSGLMTAYVGGKPADRPFDDIVSELVGSSVMYRADKDLFVMGRLIIPAEKKKEFRERLAKMGYTHRRIFPGFKGIVEEMKHPDRIARLRSHPVLHHRILRRVPDRPHELTGGL